jgi:retinol dehydrogenase 12
MEKSSSESSKILITGGTSGLGLELVKIFLRNGYFVVATGRKTLSLPEYADRFIFCKVDFCDLNQTASAVRQICESHEFDFVINNAGILSPPDYTTTVDGFESTFQINYLAHLLVNEIIVRKQSNVKPLKIAAITSPVYRLAKLEKVNLHAKSGYKSITAYSKSKLYMVLMCKYLTTTYSEEYLLCFSFNPGVFRSGIYRMRGRLFQFLYRIAAPYMRKPSKIAAVLFEIITEGRFTGGTICNFRKKEKQLPDYDPVEVREFWNECYKMIAPWLR